MKGILVAVDFSECSRKALHVAVQLARSFVVPLRVLYVFPERLRLETSEEIFPLAQDASAVERELSDFVLAEIGDSPLPELSKSIGSGIDDLEILLEIEKWGASLVVVGSHGRSALGRIFLGSVSNRVLRQAKISVLVVRQEQEQSRFGRILAAIDGEESSEGVLRTALQWQHLFEAELHVVHVLPNQPEPILLRFYPESVVMQSFRRIHEQISARIHKLVEKILPSGSGTQVKLLTGTSDREICEHAREGEFDLIVIGAHHKHGVFDLGNTAARVAHHSPCSVLVARTVPEDSAE